MTTAIPSGPAAAPRTTIGRSSWSSRYVVGGADDAAERVADQLADAALSGADPATVQLTASRIRRSTTSPAGSPASPEGGPVGAELEARIDRSRASGGRPLAASTRASLEHGFGVDLSGVRVHEGREPAALNTDLNARAFTVGSDIFFSPGEYRPHTSAGMRLLAHETAHVVGDGPAIRRSSRTVIRRTYAALSAPDKARVDSLAERIYAEKAEEFEYKLGKNLENNRYAIEIADVLMDKVKQILDAWAVATRRSKGVAYAQELAFTEGDKYYGAFEMTGAAVKQVFDDRSQPMRKKLKIVYNAVRNNNLAKWLKVAADDLAEAERVAAQKALGVKTKAQGVITARYAGKARNPGGGLNAPVESVELRPGFAAKSGLGAVLSGDVGLRGRVDAASAGEAFVTKSGRKVHAGAIDMFSGLARGLPAESAQIDEANRARQYQQNRDTEILEQRTLTKGDVPDLSSAEIRFLMKRQGNDPGSHISSRTKRRFKATAADKIAWEQGRESIRVMDNSVVHRNANSIKARLEAGVSGSTNMMLATSKNLGVSDLASLQKLRLAMLGWMLPNHDHSFWEIMTAAHIQGVPFITDPAKPGKQYELPGNFVPEDVTQFKNLLPDKHFPRWYLLTPHKNKLAGAPLTAEKGTVPDGLTEKKDRFRLRRDVRARGIDKADTDAVDDRALVELQKLGKEVAATVFDDEAVTDLDPGKQANLRAKAVARNRLRHRALRDGAAYQYLVVEHPARAELWLNQLLRTAAKPVSPGGDLLTTAQGKAVIPAQDADAAAMRAQLRTDGLAADVAAAIELHQLVDLLHIKAMAASLAGTGPVAMYDRIERTPQHARLTDGRLPYSWEVLNEVTGLRAAGKGAGIPASLMRSMQPKLLAKVLDDIRTHVRGIATLAVGAQEAALGAVATAFPQEKAALDQLGTNRFNLVVAALARVEGVTLAGNTPFATLARAAQVLGPETITGPTLQAESGLTQMAIDQASDQVDDNIQAPDTRATFGLDVLAAHEIAAINKYTKLGGMGAWQASLWDLDTSNKMAADKLTKLAPTMRAAVAGLAKLPAYNQPVYGAQRTDLAGNPAKAMQIFKKGTVHPQNNFLSMSETITDSFIPKAGYGVAWVILAGHRGKQIDKISTNPGEKEVLFAPGSRFIVDRDPEDQTDPIAFPAGHGKVWVWLREIT